MALHRCVVADFRTGTTLTELDLSIDTCQRRIIIPGQFQASASLANRDLCNRAAKIKANRTKIHMWSGNIPWGSYFIRHVAPQQDEEGNISLKIVGQSLEVYPYLRKIRSLLTYTADDDIDIARALLNDMMSRTESQFGLQLMAGTRGVIRDRTYKPSENASYGQRLEELANVSNGFEYMIRDSLDPVTDQLVHTWVWATQLGTPGVIARDITQKGHIKAWAMPEDGTVAGNAWQAFGATLQSDIGVDSEPQMSTVYEDAASLAAGYPLLDQTVTFGSVKELATLNAHAQQLRDTRTGAVTVPRILVRFDDAFSIDPNYLGDLARFTLVNDFYPLGPDGAPTMTRNWRIVGMDLHTPQGDDQEERAELIFQEAT